MRHETDSAPTFDAPPSLPRYLLNCVNRDPILQLRRSVFALEVDPLQDLIEPGDTEHKLSVLIAEIAIY
jgi:hypothetical protein